MRKKVVNMLCMYTVLYSAFLAFCTANPQPAPTTQPISQQYTPFTPPRIPSRPILVLKRQSSCPADHASCASLNAPEACCPSNTNCARDAQGHIACCPLNNVCTGILGGSDSSMSMSSTQQTNSISSGLAGTITITSTAGVTGPAQTTAASITGSVAGGGATIPNAYYPFVYMPTSFANAAICSSYIASCSSASTACFQSLAGVNGVTIGGIGGGTTQTGSNGMAQTGASSICSSLSQSACYGVQSSQCAQFGSTGGSPVVQFGGGPRETGCPGMMFMAAAAGAAAGAMGMVI